ncbi:AAA family ATPase [Microcoleus sp. AR_TQ3_B6]|uniref:AAA family ATPase n=1 Tax=Microcoleus sp. AR_TQ3_B6 TaxID=3055284 RepID=UPI002FD457C3
MKPVPMSHVFDRLQISGYRALQLVNLSQLGQVNIFVGDNNAGKTSILEAISILCNPLDPFQWLEVSQRRLYLGRSQLISLRPNIEALKWIFSQKIGASNDEIYQAEILIQANGTTPIHELKAKLGEIYGSGVEKNNQKSFDKDISSPEEEVSSPEIDSVRVGLELEIAVNLASAQLNLFPPEAEREIFQFWENERFVQRRRNKPIVKNATIFPSYSSSEPILERLSRIIRQEEDGKNEVLELIRSFDNNILDIEILPMPTALATLYIKHKELGLAPLYVFGDGFKRALVIALTLLTTANGVLLVDEIETSIHVSALGRVFSWLIETCRRREIQLFVTTHSLEAIDAMLQPEIATDNVVAFRLNHNGQAPQRFSGNLLHRLRSERGLDVR